MLKWMWEEQSNSTLSLLRRKGEPSPSLLANPPRQSICWIFPAGSPVLAGAGTKAQTSGRLPLLRLLHRHRKAVCCIPASAQEKTAQLWLAPV